MSASRDQQGARGGLLAAPTPPPGEARPGHPERHPLAEVVNTVASLQKLLDDELVRARTQTEDFTRLDVDATLSYAEARTGFTNRLSVLEGELAGHIGAAASALGVSGFDLDEVRRLVPGPGAELALALARLGETAAAVRRQDALNNLLAARARACVSGWLRALTGAPAAYDRHGAARGLARFSTSTRVA